MGKLMTARWVDAPVVRVAGTSISPMVSRSMRVVASDMDRSSLQHVKTVSTIAVSSRRHAHERPGHRCPCFKAYDIRGRIPTELNRELVVSIARAFAAWLKPKTVVVGYDSPAVESRVRRRRCAMG
jgi:hypothetical protein